MGHFETFLETFWSQKMLVCGLEVCVLQLVGQGPVAQKYMREAGPRGGPGRPGRQNIGMMETRSQSQWEFQDPNMSHITFT